MTIIEKLKKPELAQPFGLRSIEEQEAFREAGPENSLLYTVTESWVTPTGLNGPNSTFILEPDYEPEPESTDKALDELVQAWNELVGKGDQILARFRKE